VPAVVNWKHPPPRHSAAEPRIRKRKADPRIHTKLRERKLVL